MRRLKRSFLLFLFLGSLFYLYSAFQMDVGTSTEPGTGFIPVILGVMSLMVSLLLLISTLKEAEGELFENNSSQDKLRLLGYIIVAILFVPIFEILGTIVAIFLVILSLNKISGAKGWVKPIALALISAIVVFVVFYKGLEVPLPQGILEFMD
jgi:hypothetical protein